MEKHSYFDRFRKMKKETWIVIAFMALIDIIGFYFSIAMSVKISQGFTLFGDTANNVSSSTSSAGSSIGYETSGPTSADTAVISLFWILSVLVLALLVYYVFFRKEDDSKPIRKEIVDGKTVIMKDDEDETK